LYYGSGQYWPEKITSCRQEDILEWLENRLFLVTLGPREGGYSVLSDTNINAPAASRLARATDDCWDAILQKDSAAFGRSFREAFEAQIAMFPHMMDGSVQDAIDTYRSRALGWKLAGAGGGGYLVLVSDRQINGTIQIKIRRP
jgi:galactokinase/mevalonate kinase-like predicted kinase